MFLGQIKRAKSIRSVEILRDSILKVNGLSLDDIVIKNNNKEENNDNEKDFKNENLEKKEDLIDENDKDDIVIKPSNSLEVSKQNAISELKDKGIKSELFLGQIRRAKTERFVEILKNTIIKVYF